MFGGELRARAARLEREQRALSQQQQQQRAKEKAAQQARDAREQEREEQRRSARRAQMEAQAQEQAEFEAELERNRGVHLKVVLRAAPCEDNMAALKGIRRSKDKICLPRSLEAQLMAQDAWRNKAMLFELTTSNGARTHAGLLNFSAPEGTVLLPQKVINCLWGLNNVQGDLGNVTVRYRVLPPGTYVQFQPELRRFHEATEGVDLRLVLEEVLAQYSTLSEGDWIALQHGGANFNLKVLDLQPASAVSILDTDLAADVGPSIETEGYLRARQEALRREEERGRQAAEHAQRAAEQALELAQSAERERAAQSAAVEASRAAKAVDEEAQRQRIRDSKAASLPPEPAPTDADVYTFMLKLPDGTRLVRRFAGSNALRTLFDFVDAHGAGGLAPNSYKLVTMFPRRQLVASDPYASQSLTEAGLQHNEAFFIEASSLLEDRQQDAPLTNGTVH